MSANEFLPKKRTLQSLKAAASVCRGCELHLRATQTVFGEGPEGAKVMFVGEQPGDQEDHQGRPFVGPAGRVLEQAIGESGLVRNQLYVTNTVKHFKFEQRGKARLHKRPNATEVSACLPWLKAELALLRPDVLVLLGATAGQALLGPRFRVTEQRGVPVQSDWAPVVIATIHPSAVLRGTTAEYREQLYLELVHDLRLASRKLSKLQAARKASISTE